MGYVPEPPPRAGESEDTYARRCIRWQLMYQRELIWQRAIVLAGLLVLVFLLIVLAVRA